MKVRKIISILLAMAMVLSCITVFAAGELLTEDYSTSENDTKPANFEKWGAGAFSNKPAISVVTGKFGKGATDKSGLLTWPASSSLTIKPYVRAKFENVTTTETLNLSFNAAAGDKKSSKAVYISNATSAGDADANMTVLLNAGGVYSYGTKIADYSVDTWYHFDVELAGTSCKVYIDGKLAGTTTAPVAFGSTTYLYYGMYTKTESVESTFYTDDFVVAYGAVSADRKTDITSAAYTIGESMISGIGQGVTVGELVSGISAGNAQLSVLNADGSTAAAGDPLAFGMKLKIASADGVNTRYYDLDCLAANIVSSVIGTTKAASAEVEVTFNGTGNESVQFYVNGQPYGAPVTAAPYKTTVNHTEAGAYSVYGEIIIGNVSQNTDTVSYTYAPNQQPTVTVAGIANGAEYAATDTYSVTINATDADGTVESVTVKLDGEELTPDAGVYSFGPLSVGSHTVTVVATDNDSAVTTVEYTFTVTSRSRLSLEPTIDFTNAMGNFRLVDTSDTRAASANDGDDYGDYMKFTSNDGTGLQYYQGSSPSWSIEPIECPVYAECDLKVSNTQMRTWLFAMRQGSGIYVRPGVIENGYLGTVQIQPNEWYHYKFMIDIPNQVAKIWVRDDVTMEYTLASTYTDVSNVWGAFYFYFNQNSASVTSWEASLDNIEFYCMIEEPYLTSVQYLNQNGDNVFANGKAGYDLSAIKLNFNNNLSTSLTQDSDLLSSSVSLSQNGVEVEGYEVSASGNVITISLNSVKTMSDYTISYTGITDVFDNAVADGTVEFSTGPAEYDVLDWTVKVNGTDATSLSGITSGDIVGLSAEIINQAAGMKNSKLVVVLYSGNKCLGMTVTDLSTNTTPSEVKYASDITVNGTIDDTVKMYAYIWSDLTAARTVQIQSFYME